MTTLRVLQPQQAVQASGIQPLALNSMTSASTIDMASMFEFIMPLMFLGMMAKLTSSMGQGSEREVTE